MAEAAKQAEQFPRVPAYAWSWLQRSRPVLAEAARRLTGGPPPPGFVDTLRERFAADPFTRDVVIAVVADVAFNGRIPRHRPAGVSWDRGLTWWAAAIAGVSPQNFEATPPPVVQSRLFGAEEPPPPAPEPVASPEWNATTDRAMVIAALRNLLQSSSGDVLPADAVRAVLDQLEGPHSARRPGPQ